MLGLQRGGVLGGIAGDKFMIRRKREETIGQLPDSIRIKVPLDQGWLGFIRDDTPLPDGVNH